jgi:DNA repair exonuclease SbcCD ATPase subunit
MTTTAVVITATSPCPTCGCELYRESGPCEGHAKDELRRLREELRKQREELRELQALLADAYILQDGLGNFIQTPDGIFIIRGWGLTA